MKKTGFEVVAIFIFWCGASIAFGLWMDSFPAYFFIFFVGVTILNIVLEK